MTYFVCQRQFNGDVEVLWECVNLKQAESECDRINSHLADAGIPGDYYAYVM